MKGKGSFQSGRAAQVSLQSELLANRAERKGVGLAQATEGHLTEPILGTFNALFKTVLDG